jgi:hypothetical protein
MERDAIMRYKDAIERSNVKLPSLGGIPAKFVFTSLSQYKIVQAEKQSKDIHFPIMSIYDKAYNPLMGIN